ncbi:3-phosphoshikimate 1-carboxyvinyltransferase [bacterium]|nr:3-phosphoshikimate 1-carboxyvinyltransferase [bacterium]
MSFHFRGRIPASKSQLIRALLLQDELPSLTIIGDSQCDDVAAMRRGLQALRQNKVADCGEAGLVLRLLLARASRVSGQQVLTGSERLLERPLTPLVAALEQLGVRVTSDQNQLRVLSQGWQKPSGPVRLDVSKSSQFLSAFILNSWNLPFDLDLELEGASVSQGYADLSLEMAKQAGMHVEKTAKGYWIPQGQKPTATRFEMESDWSSAFAVAALAAVDGCAEIQGLNPRSTQPDSRFVSILSEMGVSVKWEADLLKVERGLLQPIQISLQECPDLFPVLAVLCAFAKGRSILRGAPHLRSKESDRITKVGELLTSLGRSIQIRDDGLEIEGLPLGDGGMPTIFNPEHDHRLVMAAEVAKRAGYPIRILDPQVVSKSFPEFLAISQSSG